MKKCKKKFLPFFLIALLLTAAALQTSCAKNENGISGTTREQSDAGANPLISVTVKITYPDGTSKNLSYTTAQTTLRGVLEENNLIEGEESGTGLYVKVVDGVRADYEKDKAYWSFTKGGEYLMTGVDATPIADGDNFEIVYTK